MDTTLLPVSRDLTSPHLGCACQVVSMRWKQWLQWRPIPKATHKSRQVRAKALPGGENGMHYNQSEHLLKQVILKSRSRVIFWLQEKTCNSMNKCLLFCFILNFALFFLILSYPRGQCKDASFSHMVRGS